MKTSRFGDITIDDSKILHFKDGLPGLDWLHKFTIISSEDTKPFLWFQSAEGDDVALPVVNPLLLFPDYAPWIPETVCAELGIVEDEDVLILTVVVIPADYKRMTTNLLSPIIVNIRNNQGRQVILENSQYEIRQPIFQEVAKLLYGGEESC